MTDYIYNEACSKRIETELVIKIIDNYRNVSFLQNKPLGIQYTYFLQFSIGRSNSETHFELSLVTMESVALTQSCFFTQTFRSKNIHVLYFYFFQNATDSTRQHFIT